MHVFSPEEADLGTSAMDKEIIFVLDKSGSMEGYKIEQVKEVFGKIIEDLPPGDYFNIIFFDSTVQSYSGALMEANPEGKGGALDFVNSLEANGGTNINEALLTALGMFSPESERVPIIVFLTDGEPTEGVVSPYAIRQNIKDANVAQVSIFSIAFGIEDESNYHFLRAMSLENYGTAEWFSPEANVAEEIGSFYETISTPLITDMGFSYGGDVSETVNTGEKNLFAGSDAIVFGKYNTGAGSIHADVTASTRKGDRDFSKEFAVTPKDTNSFIPRVWAYTTINSLLDRIEVEGEDEALVSEITGFALEFGFVTPYTSLFVELPETANAEPNDAVSEEVAEEMIEISAMEEGAFEDKAMSAPFASQPKPASSSYDRNEVYEGELAEGPVEEAEEEATPGFGVFLALSGLFGTVFGFRKK
jgi:uncharacterized protein YegL